MREFLRLLHLPWDDLPARWRVTEVQADLVQRALVSAGIALMEWWPATCRPPALNTWAEVLELEQRPGESLEAWRDRVTTWRDEPVGTTGWVRDEVERITGTARVIELPREGMRCGHDRCGHARAGTGPKNIIGASAEHRAAVDAMIDRGVPPDAAVRVHDPATFDRI